MDMSDTGAPPMTRDFLAKNAIVMGKPSVRNISTSALGLVTNDSYFNSLGESYMKLGTATSEVLQPVPGSVMAAAFRDKANDAMRVADTTTVAFSGNDIQLPSLPTVIGDDISKERI
jgi:hypothetical protein